MSASKADLKTQFNEAAKAVNTGSLTFWKYLKAWFKANELFMLALRGVDTAREEIPADHEFAEYWGWAFELGVQLRPTWQGLEAGARAAIIAWVMAELKRWLESGQMFGRKPS